MGRLATLVILIAAFSWAGYALRAGPGSPKRSLQQLIADARSSFKELRSFRGLRAADLLAPLRVVLYFLAGVSVVVLAITGFVPYWLWGQHASGFSLVLHVTVGPVFAVCMTVLTLLWAHRQRLDARDMEWLSRRTTRSEAESDALAYSPAKKLTFWAMVLLSPLVMGSIMLGMYPVFATPGQQALLSLHLIAGLLFILVAIVQVVVLVNSSRQ